MKNQNTNVPYILDSGTSHAVGHGLKVLDAMVTELCPGGGNRKSNYFCGVIVHI